VATGLISFPFRAVLVPTTGGTNPSVPKNYVGQTLCVHGMACHLQFNHMSCLIIYLFFPLLPIVTDIFFGGDILAFGPPSVQASHHFFGRAPVLTLKRPRLCQLYQPNFVSRTTGRGEVLPIFFWIEHRPSGGPPGCCCHSAIFKPFLRRATPSTATRTSS
jgi:hypothetical protein